MELENERKLLVRLLTEACRTLGVKIDTPFLVVDADGVQKEYPAFIPEFGSVCGTAVDVLSAPRTERESGLGTPGGSDYVCRSYINLASIQPEPLKYVKEMLEEWGYYGKAENTPIFFVQR